MKLRTILTCIASFTLAGILRAQPGPAFVENKGQWDARARFQAELAGARVWAEPGAFTWLMYDAQAFHDYFHDRAEGEKPRNPTGISTHAWRVEMEGSTAVPRGDMPLSWTRSYLRGQDPRRHAAACQAYAGLWYEALYPGIDLHMRSVGGVLKYDVILAPGADPAHIRMRYTGLDRVELHQGSLRLHTLLGEVMEEIPEAWQEGPQGRIPLRCEWTLEALPDGSYRAGFRFPEGYDPHLRTVIDPVLLMCTFSGSTAENFGSCATGDTLGFLYGAGLVYGQGYPTSLGAFDASFDPGATTVDSDVALTKFSLDGSTLLWSTYLGGDSLDEVAAIVTNDAAELFVLSRASSSNMPLSPGAFQTAKLGYGADFHIAHLNAAGTSLLGGTYLGGTMDDGYTWSGSFGSGFEIGENDTLYVGSSTLSPDFPTTPGVAYPAQVSQEDGILTCIYPDMTGLKWSTYLGGNSVDHISDIALMPDGRVAFCGVTLSDDFPTTQDPFHPAVSGGYYDAMIGYFSPDGSSITDFNYVGGSNSDAFSQIHLDEAGDLYAAGFLRSPGYPVSPGVYTNPGGKHVIARFHPDLSVDLLTLVGSNGAFFDLVMTAFHVDRCGNVYIAGFDNASSSNRFEQLPVTPDALRGTSPGGEDFYLMALTRDFATLRYGTFFGGVTTQDHSHAVHNFFDKKGVLYHVDCASCSALNPINDLYTTPGAWASSSAAVNSPMGYGCNMAVFKIDFQLWDMEAGISSFADTVLCPGEPLILEEDGRGGLSFEWQFGDGQTATGDSVVHAWAQPGTYPVLLIALDPANCKQRDTAVVNIRVQAPVVTAGPDQTLCQGDTTQLQGGGAPQFSWAPALNLSDPAVADPLAWPATTTVYTLTGMDAEGCTGTDAVRITVIPTAVALASADTTVCQGSTVTLSVSGGDAWLWSQGSLDPAFEMLVTGADTLYVQAFNQGCPGTVDTVLLDIFPDDPVAAFTASPLTGFVPTTVDFTDGSLNGQNWYWDFGDGGSSSEVSPAHTYTLPGDYPVVLILENVWGCRDTLRYEWISIGAELAVFVPNAFTPNDDLKNDVFTVGGYGIRTLNLQIYDRWGKLLFETQDPRFSWDGTYAGQALPEGVYVYALDVKGFGAETGRRIQGSLTLMR